MAPYRRKQNKTKTYRISEFCVVAARRLGTGLSLLICGNSMPQSCMRYAVLMMLYYYIRHISWRHTWWRHQMKTLSVCDWWIPLTVASDAELWLYFLSAPEQTFEQTIETLVIWDAITLIMTSLQWIRNVCMTLLLTIWDLENSSMTSLKDSIAIARHLKRINHLNCKI